MKNVCDTNELLCDSRREVHHPLFKAAQSCFHHTEVHFNPHFLTVESGVYIVKMSNKQLQGREAKKFTKLSSCHSCREERTEAFRCLIVPILHTSYSFFLFTE